jgi:hypothetical protein
MRYPRYNFETESRSGPPTASERLALIRRIKEGGSPREAVVSDGSSTVLPPAAVTPGSSTEVRDDVVSAGSLYGVDDDV